MPNCKRIEMLIAIVVLLIVSSVYEPANAQRSEPEATKVRVALRDQDIYGALFVTIAGAEKKVTDQAQQAWIINGGRHVVYSASEGAGGYENEGQSLHLYDVKTGNQKRIMSHYFMVRTVKEVITSNKKRALLVTMEDGGLGASYLAVVDPWRGEVFFRRWVQLLANNGDIVVLGFYREGDWGDMVEGKKVRPYKKERHNLKTLLLRRVIVNKKENLGSNTQVSGETLDSIRFATKPIAKCPTNITRYGLTRWITSLSPVEFPGGIFIR